tara:strand:- start:1021 stop:1152 length:132 start_codon:yes stop_codon:yes gene_type:complete
MAAIATVMAVSFSRDASVEVIDVVVSATQATQEMEVAIEVTSA